MNNTYYSYKKKFNPDPKIYREKLKDGDLVSFGVNIKETDLYIKASSMLRDTAYEAASECRLSLENYIAEYPAFLHSLKPLLAEKNAPQIVLDMIEAGTIADTGPMAAVAGAIAEYVGRQLLPFSNDVIVENRGDIFIKSTKKRYISIYAGISPLSNLALEIKPEDTPLGICTSSGTIGYSLSYGNCDAVTVLSPSTPLADAAATALGNFIQGTNDISEAFQFIHQLSGLTGAVIIIEDNIAVWGQVNLVKVEAG